MQILFTMAANRFDILVDKKLVVFFINYILIFKFSPTADRSILINSFEINFCQQLIMNPLIEHPVQNPVLWIKR